MEHAAEQIARELGDRIRHHRHLLKNARGRPLSQEDFANRAGLDRAYLGRVERGTVNITVVTMVRIATALGVDPAALLASLPRERGTADPAPPGGSPE